MGDKMKNLTIARAAPSVAQTNRNMGPNPLACRNTGEQFNLQGNFKYGRAARRPQSFLFSIKLAAAAACVGAIILLTLHITSAGAFWGASPTRTHQSIDIWAK
jgi:hypothetical protein